MSKEHNIEARGAVIRAFANPRRLSEGIEEVESRGHKHEVVVREVIDILEKGEGVMQRDASIQLRPPHEHQMVLFDPVEYYR